MNEPLIRKVEAFIHSKQLLRTELGPVIVGVSGGMDSVVLLDILCVLGFECIAAHCNFQLREAESNRDEQFVETLAKQYQIRYVNIHFNTLEHSKSKGISIEMSARELRYAWFETMRRTHNAQAIAVAHHSDDNIESMLLNLTRGSGLKGLTGMTEKNGCVIRPLLQTSRHEIEQYQTTNRLAFVEDSTNKNYIFSRNKIRHCLIPLFEEMNPSFRKKAYNTLHYLNDAKQLVASLVEEIRSKAMHQHNEMYYFKKSILVNHPQYTFMMFELLSPFGFNSDQIKQIHQSHNGNAGRWFFSDTHRLLNDREYWIVQCRASGVGCDRSNNAVAQLPEINISYHAYTSDLPLTATHNTLRVDADTLQQPLTLRYWRPSDFFYPLGMGMKKKKISDFLIDNKVNRFEKESVMLLLSNDEVVWVVNYRPDERFKVTKHTKTIATITIE